MLCLVSKTSSWQTRLKRFKQPFHQVMAASTETTQEIFHEIDFEGKTWSFEDVWVVLIEKKFDVFGNMIQTNPKILNSLRNDEKNTFLMQAISYNRVDIFKYLMTTFTTQNDSTLKNYQGWTACHFAALCGNATFIEGLLALNVGVVNIPDNVGQIPLHRAAFDDRESNVKLMLENGADSQTKDECGRTADRLTTIAEIRGLIQSYQRN